VVLALPVVGAETCDAGEVPGFTVPLSRGCGVEFVVGSGLPGVVSALAVVGAETCDAGDRYA